jgi:hypothetical protein
MADKKARIESELSSYELHPGRVLESVIFDLITSLVDTNGARCFLSVTVMVPNLKTILLILQECMRLIVRSKTLSVN